MKAKNAKPFFRGVHGNDEKALSKEIPIEVMPAPKKVSISLSSHIGKPAAPVVSVGDAVKMGQLIADSDGFLSSRIFASVSGTVSEISVKKEERGNSATYITIENDEKYDFLPLEGEVDLTSAESLKKRIQEAGIVGLGGAAFPTFVKLSPKTKVDTLVINGAECEPYLTCDYRLMKEKTEEIVRGIRYLKTALGVKNVVFGIEKNKPDCIELFEKYEDFTVVKLKERYPMGGEKQLIFVATGRKVPVGKLPSDVGCVVQNVATAFAVFEAVEKGKPLYERVLTVSGRAVANPKNLLVKNGTAYREIIDYCSGAKESLMMLVDGGPMMGYSASGDEFFTKKATSGLLLLTKEEVALEEPTPCISCGKCAEVCPMHLMPMDIDFYTLAGDYESAQKLGGVLNCIECGACAYICPAKRAIVQSVVIAKNKLRQMKK